MSEPAVVGIELLPPGLRALTMALVASGMPVEIVMAWRDDAWTIELLGREASHHEDLGEALRDALGAWRRWGREDNLP